MKRRGLRKYFRNLKSIKAPEFLDFNDPEKAWFDLYHVHIDNRGIGNRSWKARKQHLDALFHISDQIEEKLTHFSKGFQYWIEIDEDNSYEDAIYLHSENPNNDNFPINMESLLVDAQPKNLALMEYLKEKDFEIETRKLVDVDGKTTLTYILYKKDLGLKIK